MAEVGSHKR
jgi:hypothetical protein